MYPNPQDALPLPTRPNLDQYRKLAKDLVKACKSGDVAAIRDWTVKWLNVLAAQLRSRKLLDVVCAAGDFAWVQETIRVVLTHFRRRTLETKIERATRDARQGPANSRSHAPARSRTGHPPARTSDGGAGPTAFAMASAYGQKAAVQLLLDRGLDVDMELRGHGEGHTALHVASYHAHADVVSLLLQYGARVDAVDKTWKTPPLIWALTGWDRAPAPKLERYYKVVAALVRAGAHVAADLLESDKVRADSRMFAALGGHA